MPVKALLVEHRVDANAQVSVPVAAPTITIGRPSALTANASISLLAHVLDVEPSSLSEAKSTVCPALAEHHEVCVAVGQALIVDDPGCSFHIFAASS